MKTFFKYLDPFQIIGFGLSLAISIYLIRLGQDTAPSLLIGLVLGLITQAFDLQVRLMSAATKSESLSISGVDKIIQSLDGVVVRRFSDRQEFYEYVTKRIREANKSIDDMTFGENVSETTRGAQEAFERYIKAISYACSKKRFVYRELVELPTYLERAKNMFSKNLPNYILASYSPESIKDFPILHFMLVDSEEVIMGFYQLHSDDRARNPIQITVTHPEIAALFCEYYNLIWANAMPINDIESLKKVEQEQS